MRLRVRAIGLLSVALVLGALRCASPHFVPCRPGETRAVSDLLVFGTSRPGGVVSPHEWSEFVANEITSRFPGGFTIWDADGQWRDATGRIEHERSYVLSIVHPDTAAADRAIRQVIDHYRKAFQQEAVLRERTTTCVSFD